MKLTDKRLIDFLEKRYEGKHFDLNKFINVSENDLRDTNNFKNLPEIASKIKSAVSEKKKILIYGDYDSDGICASTILYLYLTSIGASVEVFIPNRFENGYGISVDAIDEIVANYMPDLIITVDLGITAVEEVEILKQEGIDIVITDHHMPLSEVPDCLIADLKLNSEGYGFDALCGAGVAYKLVEAMAGREVANGYLDITAIATIGDIVPLVDENRVIAKLGIDKINSGDCLESIKVLLSKLGIQKLTSADVSFKIVPRINACGRIDNAYKVFEFLIEQDKSKLEAKYEEIEKDNSIRCDYIEKGNAIIEKSLKNIDTSEPSILVVGDFHEGVIGILASRICHEYNKPALIFSKTENGTLKASGRSLPGLDIHKIISEMGDLLLNFGGHKMAVGLEIETSTFEEFKRIFNQKISEIAEKNAFLVKNSNYDIEITDDDFSLSFFNQVELLEPFGCENEKPVFMYRQGKMFVEPVSDKAFKHYRAVTSGGNKIIAFGSYSSVQVLKSETNKKLIVDLNLNSYNNKTNVNGVLKDIAIENADISESPVDDFMSAIYNKYYSIFDFENREKYHITSDLSNVIKAKFSESDFGTVVVASNKEDIKVLEGLGLENYFTVSPYKNGQNVIVINPKSVYDLKSVNSYKNIIFLHKYFDDEHLYFTQKLDTYEPDKKLEFPVEISKDRQVFVKVYSLIKSFEKLQANDVIDLAYRLSLKDQTLNAVQILFCLIVFMELNFLEFSDKLNCTCMLPAKKMELTSSKVYNILE